MRLITCEIDGGKPQVAVIGEDNLVYKLQCEDISMTEFIRRYSDRVKEESEKAISSGQGIPIDQVKLLAPIPYPEQDIL